MKKNKPFPMTVYKYKDGTCVEIRFYANPRKYNPAKEQKNAK